MAKKIKKTCILCGKEYEIWCPTCREAINQPTWMNEFHDENCLKIYQTCSKYNIKSIDKTEAKRVLDECDLSYKDELTPATQKIIDEIYKTEQKAKKTNKKLRKEKDSDLDQTI